MQYKATLESNLNTCEGRSHRICWWSRRRLHLSRFCLNLQAIETTSIGRSWDFVMLRTWWGIAMVEKWWWWFLRSSLPETPTRQSRLAVLLATPVGIIYWNSPCGAVIVGLSRQDGGYAAYLIGSIVHCHFALSSDGRKEAPSVNARRRKDLIISDDGRANIQMGSAHAEDPNFTPSYFPTIAK